MFLYVSDFLVLVDFILYLFVRDAKCEIDVEKGVLSKGTVLNSMDSCG